MADIRIKGKTIHAELQDSTITKNQEAILAETIRLILSWSETKKFVRSVTVDEMNDSITKMVEAGIIHEVDKGKLFHGVKTIYDVVRKNQYSVKEYNEKFVSDES